MRKLDPEQAEVVAAEGYTKHVLLKAGDLASEGARVQIVTIAAGDTVEDHFHRQTREFYHVLEGECELVVNGAEMRLVAGEMLLMEPGDVHRLMNPGPRLFRVLVFKTNAGDDTYWS